MARPRLRSVTRPTGRNVVRTAEGRPALVRYHRAHYHELASHAYARERASHTSRTACSADLRPAEDLLEDLGGGAVTGYRAASFSISSMASTAHAAQG